MSVGINVRRWLWLFLLAFCVRGGAQVAPTPEGQFVPPSSDPQFLTVVGGRAYFSADDGVHGRELWVTDGEPGHARLVWDYWPGRDSSDPTYLTAWGDGLVFSAVPHLTAGRELAYTSGRTGITPIADLNPNPDGGSDPILLGASGTSKWIWLTADAPEYGREVWRTDGTREGTALVKDVWPGPNSSSPGYERSSRSARVGDDLYFFAFWRIVNGQGVGESGLWKSDGTEKGTVFVRAIFEQSEWPWGFQNRLFFSSSDPEHGREVWVSDGTETGTHVFVDINPGPGDSSPSQFHVFGDLLLFQAFDAPHGTELWSTDGTPEGTRLVLDINPGESRSDPYGFTDCGGRLFFSATTLGAGRELWVTDGTADGTHLVMDAWKGPRDGNPYKLCDVDGTLFFSAADGVHGEELWRSDGTEQGTRMIKDISPGPTNSEPYFLVNLNGSLLFAASDPVRGRELWRSDGTEEGTVLSDDIYREPFVNPSSSPTHLTAVEDKLYFVVNDIEHGSELWMAIPPDNARLVRDIFVGPASSSPDDLTAVGSLLYFRADDGTHGAELWRSDGTEGGTILVRDAETGPEGSGPKEITAGGGGVFFVATDRATGEELWWANAETAKLVADVAPGAASSSPHNLVFCGSLLYFCADDGVHGEEVWRSDGTAVGTKLLKDIVPLPFKGAALRELTAGPGGVFFTADDGVHGRELWQSEGSPGGTRLYADLRPGLPHTVPNER